MSNTTAAAIGNAITIKLTRTNFLLWKAQVVPIVRGHQLFGYLDGSVHAPATMVAEGTGAEARQVPNPEYATWYAQDQTVMGGLLSSMTADVLPQIVRTTTASITCLRHRTVGTPSTSVSSSPTPSGTVHQQWSTITR